MPCASGQPPQPFEKVFAAGWNVRRLFLRACLDVMLAKGGAVFAGRVEPNELPDGLAERIRQALIKRAWSSAALSICSRMNHAPGLEKCSNTLAGVHSTGSPLTVRFHRTTADAIR
jgi:hypothetical protein